MKTKLIFFAMLCFNLSFGQANLSLGTVTSLVPLAPNEIFRFRPGNVTQLDLGSGFGFTADRWFSMGRVVTGSNTAYGLRFQLPNKAVTFGYQSITNVNPRIEWIDTGVNIGDLEFRSANSFTSTTSTLVATMKKNGNTIFGNPANISGFRSNSKVVIESNGITGLYVQGTQQSGIGEGIFVIQDKPIDSNFGISAIANNGTINNIAIKGQTDDLAAFNAAIYGEAQGSGATWAGFFDGQVFTTASYQSSDAKLKENVILETSVLAKLAQLKPVTYKYKEIKQLKLPKEMQHGFVAQDIETIFPELTKEISKPVFDKEGKSTENFVFKSVNYSGLISVLTAGINELNEELKLLKEEMNTLKDSKASGTTGKSSSLENIGGAFMEQNIPNPFADQTTIRYQLPNGTNTAAIIVFDLNGLFIKNYPINSNQSELTIKSSDIGRGYFIYSLVQNGQELVTKKMIVQ